MKILRNHQRSIYGVKYRLFTIIFNSKTKQYCYYVNVLGTKNIGDNLILNKNTKSKTLNKYTMPIIGLFYTIYTYSVKYPIAVVIMPFYMYFDGCRNFIRDKAWQTNVRFFNWANLILLILLLLLLMLIKN